METYSGAVTVYIPEDGDANYVTGSTSHRQAQVNLADHDHTGAGKGNPIGTTGIANSAVTTAKIANGAVTAAKLGTDITIAVIANNTYIKWRNAASSADVNGIKLNASDQIEIDPVISLIRLVQNTYLLGRNAANSANINMFRVGTGDRIEVGTHMDPATNNATDLGSATLAWRSIYLDTSILPKTTNTVDIGTAALELRRVYANNFQTQAATTGTGTLTSSDLSSFEYGTWTPVVTGGTVAGAGTYTERNGLYLKIGTWVFLSCSIIMSAHTGTGDMTITGAPFTAATVGTVHEWMGPVRLQAITMPASTVHVNARIPLGSATVSLFADLDGSGSSVVQMDGVGSIYFSIMYTT